MPNRSSLRRDPLPAFCFRVRIDKMPGELFFKSVSGLKWETEVVPIREGGANDTTFQIPGATKWAPLILKQGFTQGTALLDWRHEWMNAAGESGKMTRHSGFVDQLDSQLKVVGSFSFKDGWPSKWELGEYDASKSEVAIETLEITHHGLKFAWVGKA